MIHTNNSLLTDKERFRNAIRLYAAAPRAGGHSIGTLREKSLHAILKLYYEPDVSRHELPVGGHIADVVGEDGVIEIQTRSLSALKPKLKDLLCACRVTVVHPIIAEKRIISTDGATGEVLSVRKSPKHGTLYTEMRELYALRELLPDGNLTLRLPVLTADEFRTFGVRTRRRKKQRTAKGEYISDVIPTDIIDEIILSESHDLAILLPEGLPEEFTARQLAETAGTDPAAARMAINLLLRAGLLSPTRKIGRSQAFARSIINKTK